MMRAINLIHAIVVVSAFAQRGTETSGRATVSTSKFLWLSDLHYDPFYGRDGATWHSPECSSPDAPSRGTRGCDSPLSLVQGAVLAAAAAIPDAAFVLVTGDLARHAMHQTNNSLEVLSSVQKKIAKLLSTTFPNASIIVSLGNNDATVNYYLDVKEVNNTQLAVAANAFNGIFESAEEEETFRSGGYFSRKLSSGVTILSLNTVIYSQFHKPSEQSSIKDPLGQFSWIDAQLANARNAGKRVMLAGHIPPTIGSYRKTQFWHDHYMQKYFDLSEKYSDVVSAQLFGHLHSDEFRVFPHQREEESAPLLITASISPVFGGNPSFRIVDFDADTGDILDWETHYLDLNVDSTSSWQRLYSFKDTYGVDNISVRSLRQIVSLIGSSEKILNMFLNFQLAEAQQDVCDSSCQLEWVCVLQAPSRPEYNQCLPLQMRILHINRLLLAVAAAASLAASFFGVLFYRRRRRKAQYYDVDTYNMDESYE